MLKQKKKPIYSQVMFFQCRAKSERKRGKERKKITEILYMRSSQSKKCDYMERMNGKRWNGNRDQPLYHSKQCIVNLCADSRKTNHKQINIIIQQKQKINRIFFSRCTLMYSCKETEIQAKRQRVRDHSDIKTHRLPMVRAHSHSHSLQMGYF